MSLNWERPLVSGERCETSACVEVAACDNVSCVECATWEVSAFSEMTSCVEAAVCSQCGAGVRHVLVRDSKLGKDSPVLHFTMDEWRAFRLGVLGGQFAYDEQHQTVAL